MVLSSRNTPIIWGHLLIFLEQMAPVVNYSIQWCSSAFVLCADPLVTRSLCTLSQDVKTLHWFKCVKHIWLIQPTVKRPHISWEDSRDDFRLKFFRQSHYGLPTAVDVSLFKTIWVYHTWIVGKHVLVSNHPWDLNHGNKANPLLRLTSGPYTSSGTRQAIMVHLHHVSLALAQQASFWDEAGVYQRFGTHGYDGRYWNTVGNTIIIMIYSFLLHTLIQKPGFTRWQVSLNRCPVDWR